ncbi:hypothetical protein FKP32DRAFT_961661 [Trametes sanguinea]|nr:hypothetical protein FKP32DRAFT_961661 [Trametes sanguinea]
MHSNVHRNGLTRPWSLSNPKPATVPRDRRVPIGISARHRRCKRSRRPDVHRGWTDPFSSCSVEPCAPRHWLRRSCSSALGEVRASYVPRTSVIVSVFLWIVSRVTQLAGRPAAASPQRRRKCSVKLGSSQLALPTGTHLPLRAQCARTSSLPVSPRTQRAQSPLALSPLASPPRYHSPGPPAPVCKRPRG